MIQLLILVTTLNWLAFVSLQENVSKEQIEAIDIYAAKIDSNLKSYRWVHNKCVDCFGTDTFYESDKSIVKIENYQSCFNVHYYYKNNRLVLVTIDGSFKRECGWTEAPYCWDSTVVRDYRARIHYDKKKVLKVFEMGSKPCCEIRSCGNFGIVIDYDNKAKLFLEEYGKVKVKKSNF